MTNEGSKEATGWDEISEFDRVYHTAISLSHPRTARKIADLADLNVDRTQNHLDTLVSMGILQREDEEVETTYLPDSMNTRMRTIRNLVAENDLSELQDIKTELEDKIEELRVKYGVSTPPEDFGQVDENDDVATDDVDMTARDWHLLDYRLHIIEKAIDDYHCYSRD